VKPLLSVICYNRSAETVRTIMALRETGALDEAEVVVWDNGSTDATKQALSGLISSGVLRPDHRVVLSGMNYGCPQALNMILTGRKQGQHFVKVDNDLLARTPGWIGLMAAFLDEHPEVALLSAWYEEQDERPERVLEDHGDWIYMFPVVGHCVMHRGEFLDRTGYFDVLAPDHLYGFEDNLMAHRAMAASYRCAVLKTVVVENIQRKNSLDSAGHVGEGQDEHIARLRPLYNRRVARVHYTGREYRVDVNGREVTQ